MHDALNALKHCSCPSQLNWMDCMGTVYRHHQHYHQRMYAGNAEAHLVLHLDTAAILPCFFLKPKLGSYLREISAGAHPG